MKCQGKRNDRERERERGRKRTRERNAENKGLKGVKRASKGI